MSSNIYYHVSKVKTNYEPLVFFLKPDIVWLTNNQKQNKVSSGSCK